MKVFRSKSCVDVVAAGVGVEIDGAKAEAEAANERRRDAAATFILDLSGMDGEGDNRGQCLGYEPATPRNKPPLSWRATTRQPEHVTDHLRKHDDIMTTTCASKSWSATRTRQDGSDRA